MPENLVPPASEPLHHDDFIRPGGRRARVGQGPQDRSAPVDDRRPARFLPEIVDTLRNLGRPSPVGHRRTGPSR